MRVSREVEAVEPRARQHSSRLHRGRKHLDSRGDFSVCLSLQQISNNHAGTTCHRSDCSGAGAGDLYVIINTLPVREDESAGKESSSNDRRTEGRPHRLVPFQFRRAPLHNELFPRVSLFLFLSFSLSLSAGHHESTRRWLRCPVIISEIIGI